MAAADLRDELSCSICLSIYTDSVSLPCGHNFCRGCIGTTWDTQEGSGAYSCPECRTTFWKYPALYRNRTLGNMAKKFHFVQLEPLENRILCSYCDTFVPAVKSCLLCEASFCKKHLRGHSKSAEHVLTQPTDYFMGRKCSVHNELLKYYCCEESVCVCVYCCMAEEHRGHRVELLSEASEKKKEKVRKVLEKLRPEREETERGAQRLQERRREVSEKAAGETERVTALFRDIREQLEALEKQLLRSISWQKKKLSLPFTSLIQELEIKKDELSRKIHHIEELCSMADPLTVLQEWESNGATFYGAEGSDNEEEYDTEEKVEEEEDEEYDTEEKEEDKDEEYDTEEEEEEDEKYNTEEEVEEEGEDEEYDAEEKEDDDDEDGEYNTEEKVESEDEEYDTEEKVEEEGEDKEYDTHEDYTERGDNEGGRERDDIKVPAVGDLDMDLISETLLTGLAGIVTGVKGLCFPGQEATDLLLDINTAGNHVSVSGERKSASYSLTDQRYPQTPERFQDSQVLSSRSFSSGRHYWEVEGSESGWWEVGVAYPSIKRRKERSCIGNNKKSWCLSMWDNEYSVMYDKEDTKLPHIPSCRRIRIWLDCEDGLLSFYELSEPIRHLHTFTATFTEPLHAAFRLRCSDNNWVRINSGTLLTSEENESEFAFSDYQYQSLSYALSSIYSSSQPSLPSPVSLSTSPSSPSSPNQ